MKTLLTALLTVCMSCCALAQEFPLQLKLREGQSLLISDKMSIKTTLRAGDRVITSDKDVLLVSLQKVLLIDTIGNSLIEMKYKRFVSLDSGKVTYDSDIQSKKEDEEINFLCEKILNKPFTVLISPKGKVLRIDGMKDLAASVYGKTKSELGNIFVADIDDKKMISTVESIYRIFPDSKVKNGDKWDIKIPNESTKSGSYLSSFSLSSISSNQARVNNTQDWEMYDDNYDANGTKAKMDTRNTANGTYILNTKTGIPSSINLNMKMIGYIEVANTKISTGAILLNKIEIKEL